LQDDSRLKGNEMRVVVVDGPMIGTYRCWSDLEKM